MLADLMIYITMKANESTMTSGGFVCNAGVMGVQPGTALNVVVQVGNHAIDEKERRNSAT
jgi:hypothetical protein